MGMIYNKTQSGENQGPQKPRQQGKKKEKKKGGVGLEPPQSKNLKTGKKPGLPEEEMLEKKRLTTNEGCKQVALDDKRLKRKKSTCQKKLLRNRA